MNHLSREERGYVEAARDRATDKLPFQKLSVLVMLDVVVHPHHNTRSDHAWRKQRNSQQYRPQQDKY
jgi:hypothetical protein